MKTVSTLCATSTVGIAACGYALARPYNGGGNHAHPDTNFPPVIRETSFEVNCKNMQDVQALSSDLSYTLPSRPSWLRSFFSTSNTPSLTPSTSTTSSSISRMRSNSTSQNNSRPPTRNRNKLVKRSPSQRPAAPNHVRRPSSAIPQRPRGQSPQISVSRPSTSAGPYEPMNLWRPFFKRRKANKDTKGTSVRRICPEQRAATLVVAPVIVDQDFSDSDADSIISARHSLYVESRPVSHAHMDDTPRQSRSRQRASSTVSPTSSKRNVRRSFSLSNFLHSPKSRAPSRGTDVVHESASVRPSIGVDMGRRHSTPGGASPYLHRRAASPMPEERQGDPLPTIQSLSLLELSLEPDVEPVDSPPDLDRTESPSPGGGVSTPVIDSSNTTRVHRLSLLSASEHASTLVGSESEHEYGSETVFDSMRTRISELTPIRVDSIFDIPALSNENDSSPSEDKHALHHSGDDMTPVKEYENLDLTPTNDRRSFQPIKVTLEDEEEDEWSSDWDMPSGSGDEDENRLSGLSGLRPYSPYNGLLTGSRLRLHAHSNTSNTSFGTAQERLSCDGSSLRETNSILDWNDGVSIASSPSSQLTCRPKTVHARESLLSTTRAGRRTPTIHVRSQSVPVVSTLRGRKPLPSENWDDDFLDDEDDGFGMSSEIIIPHEIKARQASVIGHLGCVREFALLVEDLKRFRDEAISQGIRNGLHVHLWDEADGIIALASLDNEEEDEPLWEKKLKRLHTWSPKHDNNGQKGYEAHIEETATSVKSSNRLSAVLLPDDDIFGGNHSATPPLARIKQALRSTPTSSPSPSPQSKIGSDKEDPIEAAKNMMEKMQTKQHSEYILASARSNSGGGKVQFDTNMLRELVARVRTLIRQLKSALEEAPSSLPLQSLAINNCMDSTDTAYHDLDLSSVDDNFGPENEVMGSRYTQSRQAIGIV